MKQNILLFALIIATTTVCAQSKKDLELKTAQQGQQIDSLNATLNATSAALDSATAELKKYMGMKQAIVDKVLGHDFEPDETGSIIDSLQANRDSTFAASSMVWQDSVDVLLARIKMLEALPVDSTALEEMKAAAAKEKDPEEMSKTEMMEELEMLKGLFDKGILTEEEYNSRKKKILDSW